MKDIAVIQTDGYWGVYCDGELAFEDDNSVTVKDIISLLDERDDGIGIKLSFIDMTGTDFDQKIYEDGGFPKAWPL